VASITARSNACLIFINQLRTRMGAVVGNPEITTGGLSLRFYASVRAELRRGASITEAHTVVGSRAKLRIIKNSCAGPFREVEFDILFGEGISKIHDLLDLGVTHGVVERAGAGYVYKGQRIGEDRQSARKFLQAHPEMIEKLEIEVRESTGLAHIARCLASVKTRHFDSLASR
jgi:recombination protein RecA